mgnify:CR=1 FL=1
MNRGDLVTFSWEAPIIELPIGILLDICEGEIGIGHLVVRWLTGINIGQTKAYRPSEIKKIYYSM